jgi:hypothetical protein
MNPKNFDPESMLKGRMAETLVEDLLKQSGNIVYRFGYEAILQNLTQIQQNFSRYSDVGERIRTIPDFIVIDVEGNPVFLEVKFRWDGKFYNSDKEKINLISELWKAKIIVVNRTEKPYFRVVTPPYFDKDGLLLGKPLIEENLWKIDKAVYDKFEILVEKYLTPTLIPQDNNSSPIGFKAE